MNPRRYLTGVLHPEGFHGQRVRPPYFEAWYIKLQPASGPCVAVIPGLFRGEREQYSFVQVVYEQARTVAMHRFPAADFEARADRFEVRVGDNRFGLDGVSLALPGDETHGRVDFGPLTPWTVSLRSPGAMGWYGWVPWLQCYHGVVSLDHDLAGTLTLRGTPTSFDAGKGYIEKDWGHSFPSYHVWLQCNRFTRPGDCLTVAIARVPWMGGSFQGFIIGLYADGRLYRFATHTGARITSMRCARPTFSCVVEDRRFRLEFEATQGETLEVLGPTPTGVDRVIDEGLAGPTSFRLFRKHPGGDELLSEGHSELGSLEMQGSQEELDTLAESRWRRTGQSTAQRPDARP